MERLNPCTRSYQGNYRLFFGCSKLSGHFLSRKLVKTNISRPKGGFDLHASKNAHGGQYRAPTSFRVFVLSDLHTDYAENMKWVRCLPPVEYKNDVLLVAGDVSETYEIFLTTMFNLKEKFKDVFFIPGNHDLWCRRQGDKYHNSLDKLSAILDACDSLGVKTSPTIIGEQLGVVPVFSWYHQSFDNEKEASGVRLPPLEMVCKDFHACNWPSKLSSRDLSLAIYFDDMNEKYIEAVEEMQRTCEQIITFSHFLPRQELCPEKRMLLYPELPKIVGSDILEVRLRRIHGTKGSPSACHIFGHTHFLWDTTLDGIRYIQAPLSYPRERKRRRPNGEGSLPFCIYDSTKGLSSEVLPSYWSDYYTKHKREPNNTELAPWVARIYKR